jgi:ABC-type uncharacterized transport system permease subunit
LSITLAVALFFVARRFWQFGMRFYAGASA